MKIDTSTGPFDLSLKDDATVIAATVTVEASDNGFSKIEVDGSTFYGYIDSIPTDGEATKLTYNVLLRYSYSKNTAITLTDLYTYVADIIDGGDFYSLIGGFVNNDSKKFLKVLGVDDPVKVDLGKYQSPSLTGYPDYAHIALNRDDPESAYAYLTDGSTRLVLVDVDLTNGSVNYKHKIEWDGTGFDTVSGSSTFRPAISVGDGLTILVTIASDTSNASVVLAATTTSNIGGLDSLEAISNQMKILLDLSAITPMSSEIVYVKHEKIDNYVYKVTIGFYNTSTDFIYERDYRLYTSESIYGTEAWTLSPISPERVVKHSGDNVTKVSKSVSDIELYITNEASYVEVSNDVSRIDMSVNGVSVAAFNKPSGTYMSTDEPYQFVVTVDSDKHIHVFYGTADGRIYEVIFKDLEWEK